MHVVKISYFNNYKPMGPKIYTIILWWANKCPSSDIWWLLSKSLKLLIFSENRSGVTTWSIEGHVNNLKGLLNNHLYILGFQSLEASLEWTTNVKSHPLGKRSCHKS